MDEADMGYAEEKEKFAQELKAFAATLAKEITQNDEWTIRGFIDIFKNVYTVSADTKVVSKILELHLFPHFLSFAERIGYKIELASHQNWYPDLTFIAKSNADVKFAVDLKTTYRDEAHPGFCNGFTLGSHGKYFVDRTRKRTYNILMASTVGISAWVLFIRERSRRWKRNFTRILSMKLPLFRR